MSKVYGYAVVDKDGVSAPLGRKVYDSKSAAAGGFYQWTKRIWHAGFDHYHLKDKKMSEQSEYRVISLVAQDA